MSCADLGNILVVHFVIKSIVLGPLWHLGSQSYWANFGVQILCYIHWWLLVLYLVIFVKNKSELLSHLSAILSWNKTIVWCSHAYFAVIILVNTYLNPLHKCIIPWFQISYIMLPCLLMSLKITIFPVYPEFTIKPTRFGEDILGWGFYHKFIIRIRHK